MTEPRSQQPSRESWTFERPTRPIGIRLYNRLGRWGRDLGWRKPLSAEEILAKAQKSAGLSDWGDEYFLAPFRLLVRSLEDEASLNPFGRAFMRGLLTLFVLNRLRVHEYVKRHPEAIQAPLAEPLIVVGMPRTGTTLLYSLLAQDPDARPLLGWESLRPAPRRPESDQRRKRGRAGTALLKRIVPELEHIIVPELEHIHPFHIDGPEECTWLMANTFVSWVFSMFAYVPSYEEWLWGLAPSAWAKPYQDYLTQLLVVQHQRGGGRWVLKSPAHSLALGPLLQVVPNSRVVLTDRDPQQVVPSTSSLFAVMRGVSSDSLDRHRLGRDMVERLSEALRRCEAVRTEQPDRVMKVQFRELVKDKPGTLRRIYEHFALAFTDETRVALEHWLANTPHSPSHMYDLSQFGLSQAIVAEHFTDIGHD